MKFDGNLSVATGLSAKTKFWKNLNYTWSNLVNRLSETQRTSETFKEYLAGSKLDQHKIKDVGGYVGGYLRQGRRHPQNVVHRQLLTLDIDFAHSDFWQDFTLQYDNAAVLHATHKHCDASPRLRLVMPLSREATPDEYVAVARQVAGSLGIDLFDNTTFETQRLMFWPSTPKDMEYYFEKQDGAWIDVDEILSSYLDWTDTSLWPTADRKFADVKGAVTKQEDPETKKGIVGAFCRSYDIEAAIAEFLPEEYTSAQEGRYTYTKGSTSGGLVIYDGKFAYSHHGTDPTGGMLCNSFDLVRIHKFGQLDPEDSTRGTKAKSFVAMAEFATNVPSVRKIIAAENIESAGYDFAEDLDQDELQGESVVDDIDWMTELDVDTKGRYLSSAGNLNLIFANDIRMKGVFRSNDFDGKQYVFDSLPWRRIAKPEPIKNVDYSGVRNYIETIYGIVGTMKIEDALALQFQKQSFHPVQEYLSGLKWDQAPRVDSLLVDYFGTPNTLYTREAIRKTLTGAVGRIFRPGIKFDLVLTLAGEQGTGKSTFWNKLGQEWFSDTFMTVQGKEALEQIQGAWVIEMAELSGLRKAEVEAVKHFISKQVDTFRPAYARASETYSRQCIFVGTTNNMDFLRDPSGNRRFLPIRVNADNATKSVWDDLDKKEIDQIWAEAVHFFKKGEPLRLSEEAEASAKIEQRRHSEVDERVGIIEDYLAKLLPADWEDMDVYDRREYMDDPLSPNGEIERDIVCVAEIWTECLGKDRDDMDRYKTRDLNDILRSLEDWEQSNSTKNFKPYGKQKFYQKRKSI